MGKPARARVLPDNKAMAIARNLRTSPRKLNLVAQTIRGKKAEAALSELTFSPKRIAKAVKKVLQSAIANATDAATAISQLNLLLAAARAHGLIAT